MTNTNMDIVSDWLQSDQTVRICGLDFRPVRHSVFIERPLCIVKGQAAVYFLQQAPHGHIWLLKVFSPGRRPADDYLQAVSRRLPGSTKFFTCKQRRILTENHVDLERSGYRDPALARLAEGAVMMPKVPGTPWASIADDLRDGKLELSREQRLRMGVSLAGCVSMLEAAQCAHRDLSLTNVFFDEDGRAYLIDWDCLYHPDLPFQHNTPIGTMGYIAPFLKATKGETTASSSWCLGADRFALAVLIIEILLVSPKIAFTHEDGSLFLQAHIDTPGHAFVQDHIGKLKKTSKPCAALAEQAFASSSFAECPSPCDWVSALKYTLHQQENAGRSGADQDQHRRFERVACNTCGKVFKISEGKLKRLKEKDHSPLCGICLKRQLNEHSVAKTQRNIEVPQVFCERCHGYLRLPRKKLDALLIKGKPILCPACLKQQMAEWHAEVEKNNPRIVCPECGTHFNIRKNKLDVLKRQGKQVLCKGCLEKKLRAKSKPKTVIRTQKTGFSSILRKLVERTVHVYSS